MRSPRRRPGGLGGRCGDRRRPAVPATNRVPRRRRNGRRRTRSRSQVATSTTGVDSTSGTGRVASFHSEPAVAAAGGFGDVARSSQSPSRFRSMRSSAASDARLRIVAFDVAFRPSAACDELDAVLLRSFAGFHLGRSETDRRGSGPSSCGRAPSRHLRAPAAPTTRAADRSVRRPAIAVEIRTSFRCRSLRHRVEVIVGRKSQRASCCSFSRAAGSSTSSDSRPTKLGELAGVRHGLDFDQHTRPARRLVRRVALRRGARRAVRRTSLTTSISAAAGSTSSLRRLLPVRSPTDLRAAAPPGGSNRAAALRRARRIDVGLGRRGWWRWRVRRRRRRQRVANRRRLAARRALAELALHHLPLEHRVFRLRASQSSCWYSDR